MQENLYLSFIWKKFSALHRKRFPRHPLFTTFLLFLTVTFVAFFANYELLLLEGAYKLIFLKNYVKAWKNCHYFELFMNQILPFYW